MSIFSDISFSPSFFLYYNEKIGKYVRKIIIEKTSHMELACYDSAEIRDKVYRAE